MIRFAAASACLAFASLSGAAFAQDSDDDAERTARLGLVTGAEVSESAPRPVDDRVVTRGSRLNGLSFEEYVFNFVGEVARPVSSEFGIARWGDRLCVGAMNIPAEAAQFVVNRISEVASEIGIKPGRPGCDPDLYIIFTEDGRALAQKLVDEEPGMFRPFGGAGGTTQGLHALNEFAESDDPVRWWQISMVVDWGGNIAIALPNTPVSGAPFVSGANSRLANPVRDELWRAYIIVDASQATGKNWSELADYLAVVSLAQIDPHADTSGYDTILNLFADASSPRRMTDWDYSFLRALYRFDQHRVPKTQAGLLADEMKRDQLRDSE